MKTIRLTAAQATVRYLANQYNEDGEPFAPAGRSSRRARMTFTRRCERAVNAPAPNAIAS